MAGHSRSHSGLSMNSVRCDIEPDHIHTGSSGCDLPCSFDAGSASASERCLNITNNCLPCQTGFDKQRLSPVGCFLFL